MGFTFATRKDLEKATRPRGLFSSKGENGHVMIVAGSSEYHGAPTLASAAAYNTLAALRIGTGYAFLYVPKRIEAVTRSLSPNLIIRTFGRNTIGDEKPDSAAKAIPKVECIAIGMGIGREKKTLQNAAFLIGKAVFLRKKVVVDADAIYCIRHVKQLNKGVVITPQDKEFSELSGRPPSKALAERAKQAASLAAKLNCVILLKGHITIVTDGKKTKAIRSRSSALAVMGTGDVLSGIIAGYMATGADAFDAAVAGAYLHSKIGDLLNREMGNHILASDVADKIPHAIKRFDRNRSA